MKFGFAANFLFGLYVYGFFCGFFMGFFSGSFSGFFYGGRMALTKFGGVSIIDHILVLVYCLAYLW